MLKIVENALVIYTDGSCHPKGRKGGFGALFLHYDEVGNEIELDDYVAPSLKGTTSQRMELEAVVTALKMAPKSECYSKVHQLVIRTDSNYIVQYHMSALSHWRQNKWCNRDGKPVDNIDLWREFVRAYEKIRKPIRIEKVKGHGKGLQKDPYNVKADKLAKASREDPLIRRKHRSEVRRKKSPFRTEIGSIGVDGQEIELHIIEQVHIPRHKESKFRCEVMSTDSPYFEKVDWLYSEEPLRRGHTYRVRLNNNARHATIVKLIDEIEPGPDNLSDSGETTQG